MPSFVFRFLLTGNRKLSSTTVRRFSSKLFNDGGITEQSIRDQLLNVTNRKQVMERLHGIILFIYFLLYNKVVGEPSTIGYLLSNGHHFCDVKTMKNEEKT